MSVLEKMTINKNLCSRKTYCIFSKVLILISLICSSYLYLTPYLSIIFLKKAIENNNSDKAAKYINFSSVRDSLNSQLMITISDEINIDNINNPLAELGISLLNPLVERAVNTTLDYTVTPKGLSLLLRTGQLSNNLINLLLLLIYYFSRFII